MLEQALTEFRVAAHDCALSMWRGAQYIENELDRVDVPDTQSNAIAAIRNAFVANWFDIGTELRELAELGLPASSPTVQMRVDRIHDWLGESLPSLNALVDDLSAAAAGLPRYAGCHLLIAGPATKVLHAYVAMADARDRYLTALADESATEA